MLKITIEQIKETLQYKDEMLESIYNKMLYIHNDWLDTEDKLKSAAYPSNEHSGMPTSSSFNTKDLSDTLLEYYKLQETRKEELMLATRQLIEREEAINRIWAAFMALDEPYFSLLDALYVRNEKYLSVQNDSGKSHRSFEKMRQTGLDLILKLYESEESNSQLLRRGYIRECTSSKKDKKAKKNKKSNYEQINFESYFWGEGEKYV